jgi:hypothetical protein
LVCACWFSATGACLLQGRDVAADVALRTFVHGARAADACAGCACGRVCMSAWWMRVCTPARPPRLHHEQRRLACTSHASMPFACPRMCSVVRPRLSQHGSRKQIRERFLTHRCEQPVVLSHVLRDLVGTFCVRLRAIASWKMRRPASKKWTQRIRSFIWTP